MDIENKLTGFPSIDKPWLKYYSEEAINVQLPDCTIYEYLWDNNKDHLDDVAISYLGKKITYRKLFENIDKVAASFSAIGVKNGDVVAVALPNIPENVYCVYALNKLGAIADLIDLRSKGETLLHYLTESEASVAVICDLFANNTFEIAEETKLKKIIIASPYDSLPIPLKLLMKLKNKQITLSKKSIMWCNFCKNTSYVAVSKNNDDVACILHTSGTTGIPKGVMLTNMNFNAMTVQLRHSGLDFEDRDIFLCQVPPFLAYSIINAIHVPLIFRMQITMLPEYQPSKFAENIIKHKPNHVCAGPADWNNFLQNENVAKHKFNYLKTMFSGSDKINVKNKISINNMLNSLGCKNKILEGYGMTEASAAACSNLPQCDVVNSVGIPFPKNTFCIYDNEMNKELSYGEIGEICIAGPTLMKGYYKNQAATDEVMKIHNDGITWLHSGDLGKITKDGCVILEGRLKRIIVRHDGIKVSPFVLEKTIMKHKNVSACCVVGTFDKQHKMGQVAVAFIVRKEATIITIDEVSALCEKELSVNYLPHNYVIIDELPLTPNGKVDYRALEKEAELL